MRMRPHRGNLAELTAAAAPASRSAGQRSARRARRARIRWWLRTGALLMVIGVMRLARIVKRHWRPVFLLAGGLLTVIGLMLPSLAAFFSGPLVVLVAMPKGTGVSDDGCWIPFAGRWPPAPHLRKRP